MRINCLVPHDTDVYPIEINNNKEGELRDQIRMFMHDKTVSISCREYWIWCDDGQRRLVTVYYDEEGLVKHLYPNHRMNALITAGRFTTRDFNDTVNRTGLAQQRNINQELKDQWGSNFIVGEAICVIDHEHPLPDVNIYGSDPIGFVRSKRTPSQSMVDEFGESKSHDMIHSNRKYRDLPSHSTSQQTKAHFANPPFEDVTYPVYPSCCKLSDFLPLLNQWGYDINS